MQPQIETRPDHPPNYIARAVVLLLIMAPLCFLLGSSSIYTTWSILTGPPLISEIPVWMRALMQLLKVVVGLIGFFMPFMAIVQALKVNREFDAGNYGGAENASKSAARQCRQSLILLVLIILIMGLDFLRYFSSLKK
jgi:hypothetical protein